MIARSGPISRVLALLLVVALALRPARAEDPEALIRARARFEAGRALYVLGDYEQALREFMIGYQLVQKPEFLINLGQCYVKLRRPDKAREMYARFLATAPKSDSNRAAVEQLLAELGAAPAGSVPVEPPPAGEPPPSRSPESTAPSRLSEPSPSPLLGPLVTTPKLTATPAAKKRFDRRHLGWIVPLAGIVLAGAVVGIYFGARPNNGCISGLACVDSSHPRH
jgi:tetratricopeptide (TPR) repeat protein